MNMNKKTKEWSLEIIIVLIELILHESMFGRL